MRPVPHCLYTCLAAIAVAIGASYREWRGRARRHRRMAPSGPVLCAPAQRLRAEPAGRGRLLSFPGATARVLPPVRAPSAPPCSSGAGASDVDMRVGSVCSMLLSPQCLPCVSCRLTCGPHAQRRPWGRGGTRRGRRRGAYTARPWRRRAGVADQAGACGRAGRG